MCQKRKTQEKQNKNQSADTDTMFSALMGPKRPQMRNKTVAVYHRKETQRPEPFGITSLDFSTMPRVEKRDMLAPRAAGMCFDTQGTGWTGAPEGAETKQQLAQPLSSPVRGFSLRVYGSVGEVCVGAVLDWRAVRDSGKGPSLLLWHSQVRALPLCWAEKAKIEITVSCNSWAVSSQGLSRARRESRDWSHCMRVHQALCQFLNKLHF